MPWHECPFVGMPWCECSYGAYHDANIRLGVCHDANVPLVHAMMQMPLVRMQWMLMLAWVFNECKCLLESMPWCECLLGGMPWCECPLGSMPWCECPIGACNGVNVLLGVCHDANVPLVHAMMQRSHVRVQMQSLSVMVSAHIFKLLCKCLLEEMEMQRSCGANAF